MKIKRGCVIVNAYAEDENYLYQARRMKTEFEKLGAECDIVKNSAISVKICDETVAAFSGYDFAVFWDKDKYLLSTLEKIGVKTFNNRRAIELCDDKVLTYIALSGEGLPLAKTIPAPLCYTAGAKESDAAVDGIIAELGLPLIVKEAYGSLGKGVYLAKDGEELKKLSAELIYKPHLYQKYISSSKGKDIRLIAVGNRVLGAMQRISDGDFRSNIGAGGRATIYEPTKEMIDITLKAKKILGLDYCGIDLLSGENGEPIICEVNSNAFFSAFESVTHVNVAEAYAGYVLNNCDNQGKRK